MSDELDQIAGELGEVYFIKKDAEKELSELRTTLFDKITETFDESQLAQKTYRAPYWKYKSAGDAQAGAEKFNSGWRALSVDDNADDTDDWVVLLGEDPGFKQASIVVEAENVVDSKGKPHPGYVVTKTVRKGTDFFDIEQLQVDDEDFFWKITEWPRDEVALLEQLFDTEDDLSTYLLECVHLTDDQYGRVMVSPDTLSGEDIEKLGPYVYEGPKQLALNVRYAKPDEIGNDL
jgi:hypothetical protein